MATGSMRLRAALASCSAALIAAAALWALAAPEPGRSVVAAEGYGLTAVRNTYAPGQAAPMHEHKRPRVVVVLAGGTLVIEDPAGQRRRVTLETGQVSFRPAERHALRNDGATTIELIEMELPDAPPAAAQGGS